MEKVRILGILIVVLSVISVFFAGYIMGCKNSPVEFSQYDYIQWFPKESSLSMDHMILLQVGACFVTVHMVMLYRSRGGYPRRPSHLRSGEKKEVTEAIE